jgi:catechol 2,3-dioxygenase-like lactoylglutathione lyase family enzyme
MTAQSEKTVAADVPPAGETIFTYAYAKLPARDVRRARAFFSEKLGLAPIREHENHLYYRVGGVTFILFPSTAQASGTHDQLGLVVDDLDSVAATLRARGVEFEDYPVPSGATKQGNGVMNLGGLKAAWFKDSEGNLISIAQFPGGSPFRG